MIYWNIIKHYQQRNSTGIQYNRIGISTGPIFILIPQTHNPESILRTHCDQSLPVNRFSDHLFCLSLHLHLKITSPCRESLVSKDTEAVIKPLWVIFEVTMNVSMSHLFPIIRQNEFWMNCIRIQSHIHWERERSEIMNHIFAIQRYQFKKCLVK